MNRRDFLQRAGATAGVAGLAGCLGSAVDESGPGSDPANESETTGESDRFSGVQSDDDSPFRTISVGERDGVAFPDNNRPRTVRVWNAADAAREISLEISRDGESVLDETVEFAADAYLKVVLNEPDDYRVAVGLADADPTVVEISRERFDCNTATIDAGVTADGRVETASVSTAAGCPLPEVASTDFSAEQGNCGTEHSATPAFEGESVRVEGTVRAPTPRSNLSLAEATYDRESDALTVRVRASESDGSGDDSGMGTQCVGEVPYEATVGFEYALPSDVAVVHETPEETVEVTRASRSGD